MRATLASVARIVASDFRDPEVLFYLSRDLADLNEVDLALNLLERVIALGCFCFPAVAQDPGSTASAIIQNSWELLHQVETQHQVTATTFAQLSGEQVLGLASPT